MIGYDLPDLSLALTDEHSVIVDVYTVTPGGRDEDGNPIPAQRNYYAQDAPADLQPKSGTERAAQSATTYKATHTLFLAPTKRAVPSGATVDVKRDVGGDVVSSWTVVFPGSWGTHWELDLEAVTT